MAGGVTVQTVIVIPDKPGEHIPVWAAIFWRRQFQIGPLIFNQLYSHGPATGLQSLN